MADEKTPYGVVIRRSRYNRSDLDDLTAAGMVAARSQVDVTAVFAAEEEGNHAGDLVPALYAQVYEQDGRAVTRWSSSELTWATVRETEAMIRVLERAQVIAGLANALADGKDPGASSTSPGHAPAYDPQDPLQAGPMDRVVAEVAADLQRSWGLAWCSEAGAPTLDDAMARQLARHAVSRLGLIRDRDEIDPLP